MTNIRNILILIPIVLLLGCNEKQSVKATLLANEICNEKQLELYSVELTFVGAAYIICSDGSELVIKSEQVSNYTNKNFGKMMKELKDK